MNQAELYSTENTKQRMQLWEEIFKRLERVHDKLDAKLAKEIRLKNAGRKSFCQEKRNFNELQISAKQADTQSVLGGFWIN